MGRSLRALWMLAAVFLLGTCAVCMGSQDGAPRSGKQPNFVVMFVDDWGWGDFQTNWPSGGARTPNMDRLARQGTRFTDWHAGASVCTPSRAAIMTGRLGLRTGVTKNFWQDSIAGLPTNETTIAELLQSNGYATAMLGKWHLGTTPGYSPTFRGFDRWLGLPYSDDMGCTDYPGYDKPMLNACPKSIRKPQEAAEETATTTTTQVWREDDGGVTIGAPPPPLSPLALPLYHSRSPNCSGETTGTCNGDIVQQPVVLQDLSVKYDNFSSTFIEEPAAAGKPFFLYAAFTHVHVPQYCGARFRNATGEGHFQDAVAEVDYSVGVIMEALDRAGVANDTLVILTGDNGPWQSKCNLSGSVGPYKGEWQATEGGGGSVGKFTVWEGGHREVGVARWPGVVPAGVVSDALVSTLDIFPTLTAEAGASLPSNRVYDGMDIGQVLRGNASAGHTTLFHPLSGQWGQFGPIGAVRLGSYKAIYLTGGSFDCADKLGKLGIHKTPLLFDLAKDPAESTALSVDSSPELKSVLQRIEAAKAAKEASIASTPHSTVNWATNSELEPCCDANKPACRC